MSSVSLRIQKNGFGKYNVIVNGEGFFHHEGKRAHAVIRGDDQWFDEKLFEMGNHLGTRILGGQFSFAAEVTGSKLNEDWGQDEIYADVNIEGLGNIKSNVVKGYY